MLPHQYITLFVKGDSKKILAHGCFQTEIYYSARVCDDHKLYDRDTFLDSLFGGQVARR